MMRVDTEDNIARPLALVKSKYSDSGVVTRIWGGFLAIFCRSPAGVSPVRTAMLISTGASAARKQLFSDAVEGYFQVFVDVVAQRLQRRNIEYLYPITELPIEPALEQAIDSRVKCR